MGLWGDKWLSDHMSLGSEKHLPLYGMVVEVPMMGAAEGQAVGGVVAQVGAAGFWLDVGGVKAGVGATIGRSASPVVQF